MLLCHIIPKLTICEKDHKASQLRTALKEYHATPSSTDVLDLLHSQWTTSFQYLKDTIHRYQQDMVAENDRRVFVKAVTIDLQHQPGPRSLPQCGQALQRHTTSHDNILNVLSNQHFPLHALEQLLLWLQESRHGYAVRQRMHHMTCPTWQIRVIQCAVY